MFVPNNKKSVAASKRERMSEKLVIGGGEREEKNYTFFYIWVNEARKPRKMSITECVFGGVFAVRQTPICRRGSTTM
jgi:hypothetical protein